MGDFMAVRRAGLDDGWRLRRAREPLIADGILIPVLLTAIRGNTRVSLVPPPASPDAEERVRELAGRQPLAILEPHPEDKANRRGSAAHDRAPGPLAEDLAIVRYSSRTEAETLPALLGSVVARVAARAATLRVESIFAAVATAGVLTEARLAERLGCVEDEVPERLAAPEAIALRDARGIRYVEGFGLCAPDVLARARAAADDVARERGGEQVGRAWTVRVLGRRLREVTGASEGIECLIAYLGAA
jgi:hypothetical protein